MPRQGGITKQKSGHDKSAAAVAPPRWCDNPHNPARSVINSTVHSTNAGSSHFTRSAAQGKTTPDHTPSPCHMRGVLTNESGNTPSVTFSPTASSSINRQPQWKGPPAPGGHAQTPPQNGKPENNTRVQSPCYPTLP